LVRGADVTFDWHRFVPASARHAIGSVPGAPPCLSGQLLARHAVAIDAPVLEMTARRATHLVGFLRACKQANALAVVAVPATVREQSPRAGGLAVQGILTAAAAALHQGPIVLVARALQPRRGLDDDATLTLLGDALARDVAAGFGMIGLAAAAITDASLLDRAMGLARELDIGIELDIAGDDDTNTAFLLASVDDAGLPVAAVRGAGPLDEVGSATRVINLADIKSLDGIDPGGLRVNIDSLIDACGNDDDDDDNDELVEGRVWLAVARALRALKAAGSASRLAAALAEAP
jgi:hypothetical protein